MFKAIAIQYQRLESRRNSKCSTAVQASNDCPERQFNGIVAALLDIKYLGGVDMMAASTPDGPAGHPIPFPAMSLADMLYQFNFTLFQKYNNIVGHKHCWA